MSSKRDPLVLQYCETKDIALRDEIVANYKPLVEYIARKLAFNRDDTDDLIQVGSIAVLRSLDRFDPTMETDFSTFATPNIIGEIKHYFRDKSRVVKVPRKLQELYSKIKRELREAQKKEIQLTVSELAEKLEVDEEKILEAMEAGQNIKALSLDAPNYRNDNGTETSIIESLGVEGKEDFMLNKEMLKEAITQLDEREQRIIYLRFYTGLSQTEIAARMGLSQMHISRLLTDSLKRLRKWLEAHDCE